MQELEWWRRWVQLATVGSKSVFSSFLYYDFCWSSHNCRGHYSAYMPLLCCLYFYQFSVRVCFGKKRSCSVEFKCRCQWTLTWSFSVSLHAVKFSYLGVNFSECPSWLPKTQKIITVNVQCSTVILQIFGVVLFSVFLVVNGFTKIKKTPKCEKHIEWSRQHPHTPKFNRNRTLRDRLLPKF